MSEHIEKLKAEIKNEWFGEHVARLESIEKAFGVPMFVIRWQKPGTWCCGMEFIIHRGTVFVQGDLGEATYCWHAGDSHTHHPLFYLDLDLDYFKSKLEASEYGRSTDAWSIHGDKMRTDLLQHRKRLARECQDSAGTDHEKTVLDRLRAYKEYRDDIIDGAYDKTSWLHYMAKYDDEFEAIFGEDWHEDVRSLGRVIPSRIVSHWLGLKMAVQSLIDQGAIEAPTK